jgi:hypothetical protein
MHQTASTECNSTKKTGTKAENATKITKIKIVFNSKNI